MYQNSGCGLQNKVYFYLSEFMIFNIDYDSVGSVKNIGSCLVAC